jgi:FkbM family methyltransferase
MSVKGFLRYQRLFRHINNPGEYIFNKSARKNKALNFSTRPHKITFEVPDSLYQVFKEIFMEDVYEIDTLSKQLPYNPTIIDIGANAGFFCLQLLSKIERATIYAYEPMLANVTLFKKTVENNDKIKDAIHISQMAVTGTKKDFLALYAEPEEKNQVVASVFSDFNKNNLTRIQVPCITLEEIINNNGLMNIDLLKLDCEGSEYDIIYNSSPNIFLLIQKMTIEVHNIDADKCNIDYFNKYIQSLGYQTEYQPINNFCFALEAKKC